MAFTPTEITKLAAKVLAASVISGENNKQYFEASLANQTVVDGQSVWSDMSRLKDLPANNIREACALAEANDDVIRRIGYNADGSFDDSTAIRLTPVLGTNAHDWIAYTDYNDPSSGQVRNLISPTQIPRPNGLPSAAYQIRIFRGLPSNNNEILTTEGFDGNEVGFFISAANGLVMFADDTKPAPTEEIYMVGFQYIGATGGGSFSGNSILLEDPEGNWRVRNDYPHLRFERRDVLNDGTVEWNSYANMGASIESDGLTLTRPYDINVNFATDALNSNTDPDFRPVFQVSGTQNNFVFGNSQHHTVLQTLSGEPAYVAAALRQPLEVEDRPLEDLEIVLDNTSVPEVGSNVEHVWYASVDFDKNIKYVKTTGLMLDVTEITDEDGNPAASANLRVAIEDKDGLLIQENLSVQSLNAGIKGGFELKQGKQFYKVTPEHLEQREAIFYVRLTIQRGFRVVLKAGEYDYIDKTDNDTPKKQIIPYQQTRAVFIEHAGILDETNARDLIYKNQRVILDTGIHTYYEGWSENQHQLVGVGEHVLGNRAVLGNYEAETYIATGTGGLFVLFQDDSTKTQFWTEGDIKRLADNKTPQYFIETDYLEVDLEAVFSTELTQLGWEVVNVERLLPLMRQEYFDPIGYRVRVESKVLAGYQFQENMNNFEFEDRINFKQHTINPTIDLLEPEYTRLRLPRSVFTVNKASPRKVIFQFEKPVKIYGYYKDPTDPNDPVNTGTFVPSIKADVYRVFEEPVVVGSDLEDRVDQIEGEREWAYASENNLPTLHIVPSLLALADEDGEWLLFSDLDSLYSDQDEHQWIFSTGVEAYYEPSSNQATRVGDKIRLNPLVVHVPYDSVQGFKVSFGWSESLKDVQGDYVEFRFYIATHGRGMDAFVLINIPKNASISYEFNRRRDGKYAYRAMPYNDNLSSTVTSGGNLNYPEDPNPPIITED